MAIPIIQNSTNDVTTENDIKAYQLLGSTIIAEPIGMTLALVSTTGALQDNIAWYTGIYIEKPMTVTGFKWLQSTQGNYTADQNNYGALYSYSAGTMTQVAISANDGNIWKATSNTISSAAFTAPYSAQPGVYFLGILYNSSAEVTAPTLEVAPTIRTTAAKADFTNSAKLRGLVSTQNTLPATQVMSGMTGANLSFWIGLY